MPKLWFWLQLRCVFDPWPRNFHMPWVLPEKKKVFSSRIIIFLTSFAKKKKKKIHLSLPETSAYCQHIPPPSSEFSSFLLGWVFKYMQVIYFYCTRYLYSNELVLPSTFYAGLVCFYFVRACTAHKLSLYPWV